MIDRFHFGPKERWPEQYAAYRSDPSWQRILAFLKRECYWHVTNPVAWKVIRASRAIKPNVDGTFPARFDTTSQRSYGYINKYISLFDFRSPSEEQLIRQWGNAWDVLTNTREPTILLQLRWDVLFPKIVPNNRCWDPENERQVAGCIPFCEVWYPEAFSTDAIEATFRVPSGNALGEFNPERIRVDDDVASS